MKIFSLIPFLFFAFIASGQITVTSDDMPKKNQTYYRSTTTNVNFDPSATGANYTWDFSDLITDGIDTLPYRSISQTPIAYQFAFNNPFQSAYLASEALKSDDIDLIPQLSFTNIYLFTKNSASNLNEVGTGITVSGIPMPIQYSNIKTIFTFPLSYGQTETDNYKYEATVPSIGTIGQEGTVSYEVDGWGKLILPNKTLDVIRIKREINKSDTIYLDLLGFGFRIPSTELVYEWYGKGEGVPLLSITEGLFNSTAKFKDFAYPLSVDQTTISNLEFAIYPVPIGDVLNVSANHAFHKINIYNALGQLVYSEAFTVGTMYYPLPASNFEAGVYILEIKTELGTKRMSFIKD